MSYQALYRKWRPMVFDDVVGQNHITATIKNEILNNKISHAYLFTGTRGTGKTSTAKIFSRAVNCLNPQNGNPCNECEICKGIISERILDVIEINAASNTGVDNIRDIIEQTKYAASESKYRVYIVDEVHMLSQGAFNALLKTLEEPSEGVIFILATTEIHKVPATIMSRCQRFEFKTINVTDIYNRIKYILDQEKISVDGEAIEYVARLGDGSMRDSLSILDQCLAFKSNNLTYDDVADAVGAVDLTYLYDVACCVADGDVKGAVDIFEKCVSDGKNTDFFADGLLDVYRNLLLYKISGNAEYTALKLDNTKRTVVKYTTEKLMYCIEIITKLINDIKFASSPRVHIEMALVKLATPALDDSPSAILARISEIEAYISSGTLKKVDVTSSEEKNADETDLPWESDNDISENIPETVFEENVAPQICQSPDKVKTICDNWSAVTSEITNSGRITLYMAIMGATPHPTGDCLSLVFEDASKRDAFTSSENKTALKECISKVFDFDGEIKYLTKTQLEETVSADANDLFGKIEQISREFPENIEI